MCVVCVLSAGFVGQLLSWILTHLWSTPVLHWFEVANHSFISSGYLRCGIGGFVILGCLNCVWTRCMLCISHTTTIHKLFSLHVFRWAGPLRRVDCLVPRWEIALSIFSQGHSDALPHQESNQGFATFRLLTWISTNWARRHRVAYFHPHVSGNLQNAYVYFYSIICMHYARYFALITARSLT